MRVILVTSLSVTVLVIAGLLVLPWLIVWDDYRDELTEQVEGLTGQTMEVAGRIDLNLLPRPTLSLAQTTLVADPERPAVGRMEVDRLDLRLHPLPLLRGEFAVEEMRLVRPILELAERPDSSPAALVMAAGGGMLPVAGRGPSRVRVVDGRAVIVGADHGEPHRVEAINLSFEAVAAGGPYSLGGAFILGGQPFHLTARLGRIVEDAWSTVQLELIAEGAGDAPATLTFRGLTWGGATTPRVRGDFSLTGGDLVAGASALMRALGNGAETTALPLPLATDYRLSGRLTLEASRIELDDLQLEVAETEARGRLELWLEAIPRVDAQLELVRLGAPVALGMGDLDVGRLAVLASAVRGRIDVAVPTLSYRGEAIRRLRATLTLEPPGRVRIDNARAILPGQTNLSFAGAIQGLAPETVLSGDLSAVTNDLGTALRWLDIEPGELPEGRLRTLSLTGRLTLDDDSLRLTEAELRVDASRLSGSLAVTRAPPHRIAAAVELDRLNLDAYWPDGDPARLAEPLLGVFSRFDAAVEVRVARLLWRGLRLQDVVLDGRSVEGRLTLNEISLAGVADSRAQLTGEYDLHDSTFDLSAELHTGRPAQLLRRLDLEAPLILARLAPLSLRAEARGTLERTDLQLTLDHDEASLEVAGVVGWTGEAPTYELDLDARHPDYRTLLADLGLVAPPEADRPAPLSLTGKLKGDAAGDTTVVGTARLGEMSLTGRVGWQAERPRSRLTARISAGEPRLDTLVALGALAGLRPAPVVTRGPRPGAWSDAPLALRWLDSFDADVELSAKGGVAGAGFEAAARLEGGRMLIDRLSAPLWNGRMNLQLSLDVRRRLPFAAIALDLRAIDSTALAAWLDLPPVIEGSGDVYLEATAAGDNLRDLIRGLIGRAEVTLRRGRLLGAPLAALRPVPLPGANDESVPALDVPRLTGSFEIKRGIATVEELRLELDGTRAHLAGSVDLLLWVADLEVALDDHVASEATGLHLIGPLDRPQIRLLAPEASPAPGQAP